MAVEVIDGYGRVVETIDGDPYRTPGAIVPAAKKDKSIAPDWLISGCKLSACKDGSINWISVGRFRAGGNRRVFVPNFTTMNTTAEEDEAFRRGTGFLRVQYENGRWILSASKKDGVIREKMSFWNYIEALFGRWIKIDEIREVESYD